MNIAPSLPGWLAQTRLLEVASEGDVYSARAEARRLAAAMGFDAYAALEIETAVSELAGNVWHHGGGGQVWLRRRGKRLSVTCLDRGPGFSATAGEAPRGLGIGLGGAARLMHRLRHGDRADGGAWVHAWRSLDEAQDVKPRPSGPSSPSLRPILLGYELAVCSRSAHGEAVSGDGLVALLEPGPALLLALIDGLGHGEGAADAADRVAAAVVEGAGAPLPALLAAADRAARSTRGAVAGLLRLRRDAAEWAGVGNVALVLLPDGRRHLGQPGCLGVRRVEIRAHTLQPLPPAFLLLTDGAMPAAGAARPLSLHHARRLAEEVVLAADRRDDATALAVVRARDARPLGRVGR